MSLLWQLRNRTLNKNVNGKKKPEPAIDTKFQAYSFNVSVDASTLLKTFLNFFDEVIIKKIYFESNLKSVQKNKPASIRENETKHYWGSTLKKAIIVSPQTSPTGVVLMI